MGENGGYAEELAAIGRLLDSEGAGPFAMLHVESTVVLLTPDTQQESSVRRVLASYEVESLVRERASHPAPIAIPIEGARETLLECLGGVLERERVDVVGIIEQPDGYQVSGRMRERYVRRFYPRRTLAASAAQVGTPRAHEPLGAEAVAITEMTPSVAAPVPPGDAELPVASVPIGSATAPVVPQLKFVDAVPPTESQPPETQNGRARPAR